MLMKNREEIFLKEVAGKGVICIGAGNFGIKFLRNYQGGVNNIIVCDNAKTKQGQTLAVDDCSYEIQPVEKLLELDAMNFVIVIALAQHAQIYNQISELKLMNFPLFVYPFFEDREVMFRKQVRRCFSDYYFYNHMDLSKREEFIENEMKKIGEEDLVIPYLPVYLTTRCTLNCEKCNNLMPYFGSRKNDFSLEKTKRSLIQVLENVKELTFCELVGGEPFLYRDLADMIHFVGEQSKVRQIVIVTNGTVIPSEEILQLLKKYDVLVRISDYGMFDKMAGLVSVLEKNEINLRVLQDMKWNDPGGIEARGKTDEELYFQFYRCNFSLKCKYLMEDKLFTCARIASLYLLNQYDAKEDVLIIDETTTKEKLKSFYLQETGKGCDYCDLCSVNKGDEIPAAKQVGRDDVCHSQYTIIRNDDLERLKKNQRR